MTKKQQLEITQNQCIKEKIKFFLTFVRKFVYLNYLNMLNFAFPPMQRRTVPAMGGFLRKKKSNLGEKSVIFSLKTKTGDRVDLITDPSN